MYLKLVLALLQHLPGGRTSALAALPKEALGFGAAMKNVHTEFKKITPSEDPFYLAVQSALAEWADVITVAADVLGIDSDETL